MLWGKRRDSCKIVASINLQLTELLMQKPHDNSKASPAAFMQDNTLIAVIELSLSNWLVDVGDDEFRLAAAGRGDAALDRRRPEGREERLVHRADAPRAGDDPG